LRRACAREHTVAFEFPALAGKHRAANCTIPPNNRFDSGSPAREASRQSD